MAFEIIRGEKVTMPIQLQTKSVSGVLGFYNLTGATEIKACFKNQEGEVVEELSKTLTGGGITVVSATEGRLQIGMTTAESLVLEPVEDATLELAVTFGAGNVDKIHLPRAYSVIRELCP